MIFVAASAVIEMVLTGLRKAAGHAGAAWSRLTMTLVHPDKIVSRIADPRALCRKCDISRLLLGKQDV
jgi:hypothetical protein